MNLRDVCNEYYDFTPTTIVYPDANTGNGSEVMYLTLGLMSEVGEWLKTEPQSDASTKEAGDCFWYGSNLAHTMEVDDFFSLLTGSIGAVRNFAHSQDFSTLMFRLLVTIADSAKKYYRDGTIDKEIFLGNVGAVLGLVASTLATEDDLINALLDNREKLESRMERNVIQGSGDER
ncbi:MAG: hypothetical protein GF393_12900 [Armatimonadia bacterium]|nr:hypothetical protein [Armatimonadia bacterium]